MKRRSSAILLALTALLLSCNSDARQLLKQAEARWREGNYDDALRLNTLLYQRERTGHYAAEALLNIGNIYYLNRRELRKAIESYTKLTHEFSASPQEFKARRQLAAIYANEVGDLTQAILEYDRILEDPAITDGAFVRLERANAWFRKEEYDRALRELVRIQEEENVTGHLSDLVNLKIGNVYQIQNRHEDAVASFARVEGAACIDCRRRALVHLMESYEALCDFDKAEAAIRKLDRPENDGRILRELARLAERRRMLGATAGLNWTRPRPPARASARSAGSRHARAGRRSAPIGN